MKKLDARRLSLIIGSVIVGTVFSAFLLYNKYGQLGPAEMGQVVINLLFGLAVVFGVAIFLRSKK